MRPIFLVLLVAAMVLGLQIFMRKRVPKKLQGLVIVNVLDRNMYDDCHIKGSIHIPFDQIDSAGDKIEKDAEVVLYCTDYMCAASGYARNRLLQLGFKNVWAYEGGIAEWYNKGLPVDGPCKIEAQTRKTEPLGELEEQDGVISAEMLKKKMDEVKK